MGSFTQAPWNWSNSVRLPMSILAYPQIPQKWHVRFWVPPPPHRGRKELKGGWVWKNKELLACCAAGILAAPQKEQTLCFWSTKVFGGPNFSVLFTSTWMSLWFGHHWTVPLFLAVIGKIVFPIFLTFIFMMPYMCVCTVIPQLNLWGT